MNSPYNKIASGVSEKDFKDFLDRFLDTFIYFLSWFQLWKLRDILQCSLKVKYFLFPFMHVTFTSISAFIIFMKISVTISFFSIFELLSLFVIFPITA